MAVQQNKKSPSKRGMHRSHDFLVNPPLALEPTTGEVHLRHHDRRARLGRSAARLGRCELLAQCSQPACLLAQPPFELGTARARPGRLFKCRTRLMRDAIKGH